MSTELNKLNPQHILRRLQTFIQLAISAESSLELLRNLLHQECGCPCQYAQIFNAVLNAEGKDYYHIEQVKCKHQSQEEISINQTQYSNSIQGMIDLDDILKYCARFGIDFKLNQKDYEEIRNTKEILANYLGLQSINEMMDFINFKHIIQPKYNYQNYINKYEHTCDTSPSSSEQNRYKPNQKHILFTNLIQTIIEKYYYIETRRIQLSKHSKQIYDEFHKRYTIVNSKHKHGYISKEEVKQFMHQFKFYTKKDYAKLCSYAFGNEQLISWDNFIGHFQEVQQNLTGKKEKPTIQKINETLNTSSSKYEINLFLQDIDKIQKVKEKNKERQNNNKREKEYKKQSNILVEINGKIDEKINQFVLRKSIQKKYQKKQKHARKFSMSNKENQTYIQPLISHHHSQFSVSQTSLKIKEIQERAMQRYLADRHIKLSEKVVENYHPLQAYNQHYEKNIYHQLRSNYQFPTYKQYHVGSIKKMKIG